MLLESLIFVSSYLLLRTLRWNRRINDRNLDSKEGNSFIQNCVLDINPENVTCDIIVIFAIRARTHVMDTWRTHVTHLRRSRVVVFFGDCKSKIARIKSFSRAGIWVFVYLKSPPWDKRTCDWLLKTNNIHIWRVLLGPGNDGMPRWTFYAGKKGKERKGKDCLKCEHWTLMHFVWTMKRLMQR